LGETAYRYNFIQFRDVKGALVPISNASIATTILELCAKRAENNVANPSTICPSEVARALSADNWRALMNDVRTVGTRLAQEKKIEITQRGEVRDPNSEIRGAIRYRLNPSLSRSAGEGAEGG
jgi:Protein of unknown function (DUF3253)